MNTLLLLAILALQIYTSYKAGFIKKPDIIDKLKDDGLDR